MSDPVIRNPHTAPVDAPPTLVEFLTARLDEDEQTVRATEHADGPATLHWRPGGRRVARFDNGRSENYSAVFTGEWDRIRVARDDVAGGPLAEHIARHDPARVLAEIAAKRAIVELHEPYASESHGGAACWVCGPGGFPWPCTTLRFLALPDAGHDSYREEWRP